MKVLSKEKAKALAEKHGWSLARAEGFIDGEASRSKGKAPSLYAGVGIDDYSLGFRAGFYERNASPVAGAANDPAISRPVMTRPAKSAEGLEGLAVAVQTA